MPWLAEVLIEVHRDLKSASLEEAHDITKKLRRIIEFSTRSEWTDRMILKNKGTYILVREMPMLVDRAISHRVGKMLPKDEVKLDKDIGEE